MTQTIHRAGSVPAEERRPSRYCSRFWALVSLGALLFGSGCVSAQADYDAALDAPPVVSEGQAVADAVPAAVRADSSADVSPVEAAKSTASSPDRTFRGPFSVEPKASMQKPDVTKAALAAIGAPYRPGGRSPATGFDCSGLVSWSFEQVGVTLPRSAREQIAFGQPVRKNELQPGDIVVFNRVRSRSGYHSGIYVGNNQFVHSPSSGKTVTKDSLDSAYYGSRFAGARRIAAGGAGVAMADFDAKLKEAALTVQKAKGKAPAKSKKSGKKETLVAAAGPAAQMKKAAAKPKAGVKRQAEDKSKSGRLAAKPQRSGDNG